MPQEGAEATRLHIWHRRRPLVGGPRAQPRIGGCFHQICWLRWHPWAPGLLPVLRGNGCVCSHTHGNSGVTNHLHVQIPVSGEKHTNDSKCREMRNVHFSQLSRLHPECLGGGAADLPAGLGRAFPWRACGDWGQPGTARGCHSRGMTEAVLGVRGSGESPRFPRQLCSMQRVH